MKGLTVKGLEELLRLERELRQQAEGLYQEGRDAVFELARHLAPDLLEALSDAGPFQTQEIGYLDLIRLLQEHVKATYTTYRDRIAALETELYRLQQQAGAPEEQPLPADYAALQAEVAALQARLEPATPATRPAEDLAPEEPAPEEPTAEASEEAFSPYAEVALWPGWFKAWVESGLQDARKQIGFRAAREILWVLGETGEPLRSVVLAEAAPRAGHAIPGGVESRAFNRLVKLGWLEKHIARRGNIRPQLVCLTEQGAQAYQLLYGRPAVAQETPRLLALHSSADHVYLILETQQLLEQAGFYVERYFDPLPVSGGEYVPDLIATYEGTTIYVEAERETYKAAADRRRKWAKAIEAAGGALYLTVGTEAELDPLCSEILFIAGSLPQPATLHAFATETVAKAQDAEQRGWGIFNVQKAYP